MISLYQSTEVKLVLRALELVSLQMWWLSDILMTVWFSTISDLVTKTKLGLKFYEEWQLSLDGKSNATGGRYKCDIIRNPIIPKATDSNG